MKLEDISKDERSLLLFFETRAVDYGGRVNLAQMNDIDISIANGWNEKKFIEFGRIVIRNHNGDGTYWCKLSEDAWILAHEERRKRFERMWLKRDWLGINESQKIKGSPHISGMNQK